MALTKGNTTYDLNTPAAASRTFSHNMSTGANGYLLVLIAMANVVTITGVTYNGVSMTSLGTSTTTTTSSRWAWYGLASPATGANNVVVSFSSAQYNPVSTSAISFTGCNGFGTPVFDDTTSSPNSTNITVSTNSMIVGAAIGGANTSKDITLDGSSRTLEFSHNINNYHYLAFSATGLTSGSKTVSVANSAQVAGYYIEVKEVASSTNNNGMFLVM